MKKIIVLFIVFLGVCTHAQETKISEKKGVKIDFSISQILGTTVKGKKSILSKNRLNVYTGVALQGTFLPYGYNGAYWVTEFNFFKSSKKHLFLRLEPFIGVTNFHSKSKENLPDLDIVTSHETSYTYFDYGTIQGIGWQFNRFSVALELALSYKGFLDKGPFRFGDVDSFSIPGVSLSWILGRKN